MEIHFFAYQVGLKHINNYAKKSLKLMLEFPVGVQFLQKAVQRCEWRAVQNGHMPFDHIIPFSAM